MAKRRMNNTDDKTKNREENDQLRAEAEEEARRKETLVAGRRSPRFQKSRPSNEDQDGDSHEPPAPAEVTQPTGTQPDDPPQVRRNLEDDLQAEEEDLDKEDKVIICENRAQPDDLEFQKIKDTWDSLKLSNFQGSHWIQHRYPMEKIYPESSPSPPMEKPGEHAWMTNYPRSKYVRRFFPNIDRTIVDGVVQGRGMALKIGMEAGNSEKSFDLFPLHLLSMGE